jgi:branched-subunit amino acid aminotransferase/4-amino-4-deoxychorismate lyase
MEKFIFKNQCLLPETQAQISIHERGFLFGDGIFETCRIIDKKIYDFSAHYKRIKKSLKALKFNAEIDDLEKKSYQLIKKNLVKDGILKISISRGVGSVGYLPTYESKALIIVQTLPLRELPKEINLGISKIIAPKNINFKSMNALPYVLTKLEAQEQNYFDCVMLSAEKIICETSSANIFWVKDNVIYTPDDTCDIVVGTVREKILKLKNLKICKVRKKISALKNADEIFLTNSSFLIISVDNFLFNENQKRNITKLNKKVAITIKEMLKISL